MITTIERDGVEITIDVDADLMDREDDVGITGGWCIYGAKNLDTGEEIKLTEAEETRIAEGMNESSMYDDD